MAKYRRLSSSTLSRQEVSVKSKVLHGTGRGRALNRSRNTILRIGLLDQTSWEYCWKRGRSYVFAGSLDDSSDKLSDGSPSFKWSSSVGWTGVEEEEEGEEELRSGAQLARRLQQKFRRVQKLGYHGHLKEFVRYGLMAYAMGCTEEGLRRELQLLLKSSKDPTPGTLTERLKFEKESLEDLESGEISAEEEEMEECLLWLGIVFVTVMCLPNKVVMRWSTSVAASSERILQWRGFCSLITDAYYTKGMAWFPIKRLQMEQLAVSGRAESSAVVADRMCLVFATLEVVDPRWGGLKEFSSY
eukprot:TRINITY_DN10886_c2_g1_i1.p1 TRINITY_DN10886_c2_g1~~TRINITY_DN10886_c2_g1_i1.p1  ORF type:complete len:311 (-),score=56.53 TRINITY_DN10886_c2_g1_i1:505-1407(-)